MRWVIAIGVPVVIFVSFYLGLSYGLSTAELQLAEYRQQQDQTTGLLLSSILHKITEQSATEKLIAK